MVKAKKEKKPIPEWKMDAFSWLALEKWIPDNLFNYKEVNGRKLCKVCDRWIKPKYEAAHCRNHVRERKKLLETRRIAAAEVAAKARKIRALEKKIEREAMKLLGKDK